MSPGHKKTDAIAGLWVSDVAMTQTSKERAISSTTVDRSAWYFGHVDETHEVCNEDVTNQLTVLTRLMVYATRVL